MGVQVRQKAVKSHGVFTVPKDAAWWVFVAHKGARMSKRFGAGPAAKKVAEHWAAEVKLRLANGGPIVEKPKPTPTVPTFAQVAEQWQTWYPSLYPTRPSTQAVRASFLRTHLLPRFGTLPITEITRASVQDFIAAKRATGGARHGKAMSDVSLKAGLPGLRMILDYAVEKGWLPTNPMRGVRLWRPVRSVIDTDPFSTKELHAILAAAASIDPRWALMVRCWAQSGMRSGELRGLRWSDFNPSDGTVSIVRTRSKGREGEPKTPQSRRVVALTHPTCEPVAAWQLGATVEAVSVLKELAHTVPMDVNAPLFPSLRQPGQPMEENEMSPMWRRTLVRAKVRPRPAEHLRHTFASTLLSRNAPLLYVAKMGGWKSGSVLLQIYARWLPQDGMNAMPAVLAQEARR